MTGYRRCVGDLEYNADRRTDERNSASTSLLRHTQLNICLTHASPFIAVSFVGDLEETSPSSFTKTSKNTYGKRAGSLAKSPGARWQNVGNGQVGGNMEPNEQVILSIPGQTLNEFHFAHFSESM